MKKFGHSQCNRWFYLPSLLMAVVMVFPTARAVELTEIQMRPGQMPFHKAAIEARKADSILALVLVEFERHVGASQPSKDFQPSIRSARVTKGKVLIDAEASSDGEVLFNDLVAMGLTQASRYGSTVSGYLPLGLIRRMLSLDSLRVASASQALTHAGIVVSQGDAAMLADNARANYGVDGTGVLVGVMSDSYNCANDAANDQLNDDLPSDVLVLDDSACSPSGSDEGRAMMQIVHDVAPGASLAFHTAFNGIADFANGIEELAAAGAEVIVDDVFYLFEPMFQDGVIAQAVDTVVTGGTAYFSSAGNSGRNGYARSFDNSGEPLYVSGNYRGFLHDFNPDTAIDWSQAITVPVDSTLIICYQWDQPWGNSVVDMDIYLHTSDGAALPGIVASSQANNNIERGGSGQPAECLQFTNTSLVNSLFGGPDYNLMLVFFSSGPNEPGENNPPPADLTINQQYVVFKAVNAPSVTEYRTDSGTLFGHANAAGAEAVGAAFYDSTQSSPIACGEQRVPVTDVTGSIQLECYSSAGGVPIFFDTDGNRLADPEDRSKPNIVGPDGGNTTFFGFDIVNDPDGVPYASDSDDWPNFFGTSASAPHAAGVAALMLDAAPELTPTELYGKLESTAIDMGVPGIDSDSGSGFIQADSAVEAALNGSPINRPPVANNDTAATDQDVAITVDVLGNDSDPDGDPLAIVDVTQGSDGAVSINSGETVTYTPATGFDGSDSFEYTVSDGSLTDTATVYVTINPTQPLSCAILSDKPSCQNDPACIWVGNPRNGSCQHASCVISESPETSCSDGLDNDCDGFVDSEDSDCPVEPADCSIHTNSKACKGDGACRWSRKDNLCVAK